MKRKTKAIPVLALSLILSLTACGHSSVKESANLINSAKQQIAENNVEPTATPEPTPAKTQYKLGKQAAIGNWTFTVKKASVKKQIKTSNYLGYTPDKGNRFICVSITLKNNGNTEDTFLPHIGYEDKMNTAVLYYQDQYEYKPSVLPTYKKDLADQKIKPLNKTSGILVFEVPKKVAKNLKETTLKIGTIQESAVYPLQ